MKGGLMILAGPKSDEEDEDAPEAEEGSDAGHELAGEAFDALQDGDRAGFAAAFKAAVKACAEKSDGYEDEDTEES